MFCENCGCNIGDGIQFCPSCGKPVGTANTNNSYQAPYGQHSYNYRQQLYQKPIVPGKGLGIASMVLGICSICIYTISIICGIIGLVLGIVSINKARQAGMKNNFAVAGVACSSVGLAIYLLLIIIAVNIAL